MTVCVRVYINVCFHPKWHFPFGTLSHGQFLSRGSSWVCNRYFFSFCVCVCVCISVYYSDTVKHQCQDLFVLISFPESTKIGTNLRCTQIMFFSSSMTAPLVPELGKNFSICNRIWNSLNLFIHHRNESLLRIYCWVMCEISDVQLTTFILPSG